MYKRQLQTDLNVPYITNDPNEIAAGEKTIRAVTHAVHDYSKGLTASITEEQAIDFLTATINRAERGKEKFKIEKPSKFKPVFSDKFKEDNPELADVDEVTVSYTHLDVYKRQVICPLIYQSTIDVVCHAKRKKWETTE